MAQGSGREPVAAALVAWELGPVDNDDVAARSGQGDGGGRTRRAAADHDDVSLQHKASVLAVRTSGPLSRKNETGHDLAGFSVIVGLCVPTAWSPSSCCSSSVGR